MSEVLLKWGLIRLLLEILWIIVLSLRLLMGHPGDLLNVVLKFSDFQQIGWLRLLEELT